jgi:hypothetical protein
MKNAFHISDYDYITSALGNAFFSGMSFDELWTCVSHSGNREDLDVAIMTQIKLKEIIHEHSK